MVEEEGMEIRSTIGGKARRSKICGLGNKHEVVTSNSESFSPISP